MENAKKNELLSATTSIVTFGSVLNAAYPLFDFVEKHSEVFSPATVDRCYDLLSAMYDDFRTTIITAKI